jgi:molybdopterin-binding protein
MKHGAQNDINGEIVRVDSGEIMGKATVKISGDFEMSSVMTLDSIESLDLKAGDKVRVLVKAVNVLIVKD